jgi:phosphoribosylaminoimidazole carboxylase (NCAIR synthetase)
MNTPDTNRNILILGGNPETGAIVEVGNSIGLKTVVIDPYAQSPAKRHAYKSYDIDVTDFNLVDKVIEDEKIDGILVGVADPLVPYYQKLCARYNFPCYATEEIIRSFSSKANFAQTCRDYDINVTPNYDIDISDNEQISSLPFPVVVKPVDSGAGVGISICNSPSELIDGVKQAIATSLQKKILIEKFMQCDDMLAYYTFIDGKVYLSALADRHKTKKQAKFSSVCLAAEYPSKYTERFIDEINQKLINMFRGLKIENGVLLIQFFVDEKHFYAYDPGFRLQGEAPHIYLKHFNGFDQREMLLNFALTGAMYQGDFEKINDFRFGGEFATTVWVLLKAGQIDIIKGMDSISGHANVIHVLQRFTKGDTVSESMLGTERQVFARIFTVSSSKQESVETVRFIFNHLSVQDKYGEDMILDFYCPQEI